MNSIVHFPVAGRYREDAEMGYVIEDEEHDALEQCPLEGFPLYMNLRKRMDFATGIVGGSKRRISWGEITQWMHRDSARGRKAVSIGVSKARRIVGQMVNAGLLEYRTDREADRLMFFLPLARSDFSEAQKQAQVPAYHAEIQQAIDETTNCVSMDRFRQREATTGAFVSTLADATELPLPTEKSDFDPEITSFLAENTRQTFDSPAGVQADSPATASNPVNMGTQAQASRKTRQTSDREPTPKADNNNPFTPNLNQSSTIPTNAGAPARVRDFPADAPTGHPPAPARKPHRQVGQSVRSALGKTATPPSAAARVPFSAMASLSPVLETLAVDEATGFALQISAGLRNRNPDLIRDLQNIVSKHLHGEDRS